MSIMSIIIWILIVTCYFSPSDGKFQNPSLIKRITLKVKGADECVRTSQYIKPTSGYACKNLGECYKYRCGAIARHCSVCGEQKGPCIDYSEPVKVKRSKRSLDESMMSHDNYADVIDGYMSSLTSKIHRLVSKVRAVVETVPTLEAARIETMGDMIVHLRTGAKNCAGFVTSVDTGDGRKYLIMTAAQCLINFEVECFSGFEQYGDKYKADMTSGKMENGYMTYPFNHSSPCFGDYDADVTKVKKGFHSYVVVVTSYMGRNFTIPLTSKHVIVPRDYMECQDCRNDFAAIRIENQHAEEILRGHEPFILSPEKDPMDWTGEEVTQFVSVKDNFSPKLLRKAADSQFCTINYATNQKMCFNVPILPNSREEQNFLSGSPLFITQQDKAGRMEYHCIGIFTGMYNIVEENLSTVKLADDGLKLPTVEENVFLTMKYSKNGAVRITPQMVSFLQKLCDNTIVNVTVPNEVRSAPQIYPPRQEYFPSIGAPLNADDHLFLCSLGWIGEGSFCVKGDFKLSHGCTWDGLKYKCSPRMRSSAFRNNQQTSSIFQEIVIPGDVRQLELRGHKISNMIELNSVLSRLTIIQDLILDYNDIQVLKPPLFENNTQLRMLSLKHNKISKIHGDLFRHNKNLRHLNLAYNRIKMLPPVLLHRAKILQYISLENNKINFISPRFFLRSTQLEKIYIGNNNISFIVQKLFKHQRTLKELWAEHNIIQKITKFIFKESPKLSLVDFSSNRLKAIPRDAFDNNLDLKFVNFNFNSIKLVPRRLFSKQKKLVSVFMSKNPILEPNETRAYFEAIGVPYS
ncbi:uncharacterized protein LOC120328038 [Styela clava]